MTVTMIFDLKIITVNLKIITLNLKIILYVKSVDKTEVQQAIQ